MQTILEANGQIGEELARELKRNFTSAIRIVSRNAKKVNDTDEVFSAHLSVPEEAVEGLRKWPRLLSSNLSKNNLNSVINRITSIIKIVIMAQHMKAKDDPQILSGIREFLKTLNNSADKPLETLTPEQARQVLIDAQKSVEVDY